MVWQNFSVACFSKYLERIVVIVQQVVALPSRSRSLKMIYQTWCDLSSKVLSMCIELDIVNGLIIVRQNHWPTDRRQEGRTYTINAYTKPLTDSQTAGRSDVHHQCLHKTIDRQPDGRKVGRTPSMLTQNHWQTDRRQEGRTYTINAYTELLTDIDRTQSTPKYRYCVRL